MPSLVGSESGLVVRAGRSGDESLSLSFALPLLQDQSDAMQVGRQHRQGNRPREAVRTMAANAVESPMFQPIERAKHARDQATDERSRPPETG